MAKKKKKISMKNTKKEILKAYKDLIKGIQVVIDGSTKIKEENSTLIAHNFSLLDEIEALRKKIQKKENVFMRLVRWVKF